MSVVCFTSGASFGMAGILVVGGLYCLQRAVQTDHRYLAMAVMPIAVGIQQFIEGLVWISMETNDQEILYGAARLYMFFVWIFWTSWVSFMTFMLEFDPKKRRLFLLMVGLGISLGLVFYLPYFWHTQWLWVEVIKHSLVYNTILLTDQFVPRTFVYFIYLCLVVGAPLLSSHRHLRQFGWSLVVFVPVTSLFFMYADISVLCFFAALMTINLIFIIAGDKCKNPSVRM